MPRPHPQDSHSRSHAATAMPRNDPAPAGNRDWLRAILQPVRRRLAEVVAISFLVNVLAIAVPVFVLQVYDRVVFHNGLSTLQGLVIGVLVALLFDFILRQGRGRMLRSAAVEIDVGLSRALYRQITGAPLPVLESRPSAWWQALFRDAETVRNTFSGLSAVLVADLPFALLFAVVLFIVAAPVAWVFLVAFPLFLALAWFSGQAARQTGLDERRAIFDRDSLTAELIGGRTTIKALALQSAMEPLWEERHAAAVEEGLRRGDRADLFIHLGQVLTIMTTVSVVTVGAIAILNQDLSIGALVAANMLGGRVVQPFQQLVSNWRSFAAARQALDRLGEVLSVPVEPARGAVRSPDMAGTLWLDNITFGYAAGRPPAVREVRLKVGSGLHGIVGPNGSGKTTLLKLIQGLYRPDAGRVLIDAADIAQFGRDDLARIIGYVPQHTFLFAGTIRENIAIGRPDADDAMIVDAAHLAGVHTAVAALPDGYGTRVGEGGMELPGGIRQRIAIARALLGDPPVLLLDEPTGNLDSRAAADLARNLSALGESRTIVAVSHSPVLLERCNNIVLMDGGRITAAGPAREILSRMADGGASAAGGAT